MDENETKICVYCGEEKKENDRLNQVGAHWSADKGTPNPLNSLIDYAQKCNLEGLHSLLVSNKCSGKKTFIHATCRVKLKNQSRPSKRSAHESLSSAVKKRRDSFDFKRQCFYCDGVCEYDPKHPDRNKFSEVRTITTALYNVTLEICKSRTDEKAKKVEARLLDVSDLVAAEGRYHPACRTNFETVNTFENCTPGRPVSSSKLNSFEKACKVFENNVELYTVAEFHKMMSDFGDEIYTVKSTQLKLKEKYKDSIKFININGKSSLIVLNRAAQILCESWYNERKSDLLEESQRIITSAAALIKDSIRNQEFEENSYPSLNDIKDGRSKVPELVLLFMSELISAPIKKFTLSQALVAATKPRVIMPLQFGLAVSVDNQLASKWLNTTLSKLGLAVSYDEIVRFKQNVVKHDDPDNYVCPEGTTFLQFVSDNSDHDLATLDGKNTHHGLGSIAIANGNFTNVQRRYSKVPRDKKQNWKDVNFNTGIPIHQYIEPDMPALMKTILLPMSGILLKNHRFVDILWNMSYHFKSPCPSWSGYMSSKAIDPVKRTSQVSMLPIIDLPATDNSALYSLLRFISNQYQRLSVNIPCVTFDQQLHIKAYEIVASEKMNIFLRLGGFHQLMSFLGSVGNLMEGSGLRKAMESVYTPLTVGHMFTGKAYSRSVRGHFLCASAVESLVLEEYWCGIGPEEKLKIQEYYHSDDPTKFENEEISLKLMEWLDKKVNDLSASSRTSAFWLNYINYVHIIQEYIRAERTDDWNLHVSVTKAMLNLYAATGHNNYAKSCRLYLQSIRTLEESHPETYKQFLEGNHTVKRTLKKWNGIWTDLAIEQILMKSLKGRSGIVAKGITENVMNVWTKTMHRCAEVTDAMDELLCVKSSQSKHKEMFEGRIKRDFEDFEKIQIWFQEHNPFSVGEKLMALDSGLVDVNDVLTCDKPEEVGIAIHKEIDNQCYGEVKLKKSNQVTTLQSLYSTVSVGSEKLTIDPLTLFLRLIVLIERKPEEEIVNYFEYELSPYPMSLFKDGVMRMAQKSVLKSYLTANIEQAQTITSMRIADGGALLWCIDWKKNETFQTIFQRYSTFLSRLQINTVVFDGYALSTKDAMHLKRGTKMAQTVEIKNENQCPADRKSFLSNYSNKESFVKKLSNELRSEFRVVECPSDADTTIVKEALDAACSSKVTVYSDDTDVFCLLLHHIAIKKSAYKDITVANMTKHKNKSREYYMLTDVIDKLRTVNLQFLLFCHAFTGCDTTSAIYNLGKTSIFKKLQGSSKAQTLAGEFYKENSPEEIGNFTISFFELLNSNSDDLATIRKIKYQQMIISDRSKIDPSILPPSPRAAFFHGLRTYHQVKVWRDLRQDDYMPLEWGWKLHSGYYSPIMTDQDAGPQDILQIIRCNCKGTCDTNRCTCRKAGLHCTHLCKECNGLSCKNGKPLEKIRYDIEELSEDVDDRHFLDAFN